MIADFGAGCKGRFAQSWGVNLRGICRGGIYASRGVCGCGKVRGRDESLPYKARMNVIVLPCKGRACPARGLPVNARFPYTAGPDMSGPYRVTKDKRLLAEGFTGAV